MNDVVAIAGAGPAGLTAALELLRHTGLRPVVFEAGSQVGGISRTIVHAGNRMDLGGHRFFSKSDWVMNWWQEILPVAAEDAHLAGPLSLAYQGQRRDFAPALAPDSRHGDAVMLVRNRLSRIFYGRRFYDYPVKLNARTLRNLGALRTAAIGASFARSAAFPRRPERTLEDFLVNRFGDQLYRTFFKSYTEKVWGVPCEQISAEWGAQRIKGLSVGKALLHALKALRPRSSSDLAQRDLETSLIERFLYPKLGPGQMWEQVASRIIAAGGEVHLGHRVTGVRRNGATVEAINVRDESTGASREVRCRHLVSTMPLAELVAQLEPERTDVAAVAAALPYRDFMTAGLLLSCMRGPALASRGSTAQLPPDNWIYVQEPDVKLGRLQIFNNWSPHLVRDPGTVWLGLEYFCNEQDELWSMRDGAFLEFAARELEHIGLIDRADVLDGTVVRVPKAYPAYFGEYRNIDLVRRWLDGFDNLFPVGRNGMHRYNNQDHSMLAARAAVECIASGSADKRALWAVNTEEDYHEEHRAGAAALDAGTTGSRLRPRDGGTRHDEAA